MRVYRHAFLTDDSLCPSVALPISLAHTYLRELFVPHATPRPHSLVLPGEQDHRRVFAHPHIFLLSRGLVDPAKTLQIASLSAEPCAGSSFVAAAFDVRASVKFVVLCACTHELMRHERHHPHR